MGLIVALRLRSRAKINSPFITHLLGRNVVFVTNAEAIFFYRLKEINQYIMPVGLFDESRDFVFDHQVFIDEKPSYDCFSDETADMTGAEVFAKYAPPSD